MSTAVSDAARLYRAGYYIGPRDPDRNRDFQGRYMVAESLDEGRTSDARHGGFCIVGDDLFELIREAAAQLPTEAADGH